MTKTMPFSLRSHRKSTLRRLAAYCQEHDPERATWAREALQRMENGDYGFCIACGMKIPEASLESRPERRHCFGCKAGAG